MAVSKRLRFEILRRDNHSCQSCGRRAPEVQLSVDHVVPVALGGSDDPSNLTTACTECNGGKSSIPADAAVVADVANDAKRWAAAIVQAAEELRLNDNTAVYEAVVSAWTNYRRHEIPKDYRQTIDQFLAAGLPAGDIVQMAHVADAKPNVYKRWSYFCGCCWTRIRELQERATELVSGVSSSEPPGTQIKTRWTQEEIAEFTGGERLECEDHNDGQCANDTLCLMVGVARRREMDFIYSVRDWKKNARDNAVNAEAEALLDA